MNNTATVAAPAVIPTVTSETVFEDSVVANPVVYLDARDIKEWVSLDETLDTWSEQIKLQQLRDVEDVETQTLFLRDSGDAALQRQGGKQAVAYTLTAMRHLCALVGEGERNTAGVLCRTAKPKNSRPPLFQDIVQGNPNREVTLRIARDLATGRPVVRAFVSDRHSLSSGDDTALIAAIRQFQGLAQDARARYVRGWDHTRAELVCGETIQIRPGLGIKLRAYFQNSETKACSFGAAAGAYLTFTGTPVTLPFSGERNKARHLDSKCEIAMTGAVERALTDMHNVANLFDRACGKEVNVGEMLQAAVDSMGLKDDAAAAVALTAAMVPEAVPANTLAFVVVALSLFTRYAKDADQAFDAEATAGFLLSKV